MPADLVLSALSFFQGRVSEMLSDRLLVNAKLARSSGRLDMLHDALRGNVLSARPAGADVEAAAKRIVQVAFSTAAVEQTSGVSHINHAVAELDQSTQNNAALVEESAAATESLRDQAQALAGSVARFKLAAG